MSNAEYYYYKHIKTYQRFKKNLDMYIYILLHSSSFLNFFTILFLIIKIWKFMRKSSSFIFFLPFDRYFTATILQRRGIRLLQISISWPYEISLLTVTEVVT